MGRSQWVARKEMDHLLAALMPSNAEALRLSMDYGLRIGDVLRLPRSAIEAGVWHMREEKTGKRRTVRLSDAHTRACMRICGKEYVFEHRYDWKRHRTRQAVYKDLKRVAKVFRIPAITPHSARKIYSVERYRQSGGNLATVKRLLNHSSEAVTILYAMADHMSKYNPDGSLKRKDEV
jgi:integrase